MRPASTGVAPCLGVLGLCCIVTRDRVRGTEILLFPKRHSAIRKSYSLLMPNNGHNIRKNDVEKHTEMAVTVEGWPVQGLLWNNINMCWQDVFTTELTNAHLGVSITGCTVCVRFKTEGTISENNFNIWVNNVFYACHLNSAICGMCLRILFVWEA